MTGKARSISISKDRFMEVIKLKGFNISSLSRELEKNGIITHRSLQKNLSEGQMSYRVLDNVCKILDCPIGYLTKEDRFTVSPLGAIVMQWIKMEHGAEINVHVIAELDDHTIVSGNFSKVSETDDALIFYPDIYNDSREDMIGNAVDPAYILRWMPYPEEDEDDDSDL